MNVERLLVSGDLCYVVRDAYNHDRLLFVQNVSGRLCLRSQDQESAMHPADRCIDYDLHDSLDVFVAEDDPVAMRITVSNDGFSFETVRVEEPRTKYKRPR